MKLSVSLHALVLALTSLSAGLLMAASDERPRLENYPSSFEFLHALHEWNRAHPDGEAQKPSSPPVAIEAVAQAAIDPTSELAPPPFAITGPEDLDHAIERAKDIAHPAYKEKIRYRRSTHISFSLPTIDGKDMSQASINDALGMKAMTEEEEASSLAGVATLLFQAERIPDNNKDLSVIRRITATPAISESMIGPGVHSVTNISVTGH